MDRRLLCCLVFAIAGSGCVKRDFAAICDAAVEVRRSEDGIEMQRARWGMLVAGRVSRSGDVRKTLDAVEFMPADRKYAALRAAAQTLGHEQWDCPDLEALFKEAEAAERAAEAAEGVAPPPEAPPQP